jgi:hypothetical protein
MMVFKDTNRTKEASRAKETVAPTNTGQAEKKVKEVERTKENVKWQSRRGRLLAKTSLNKRPTRP